MIVDTTDKLVELETKIKEDQFIFIPIPSTKTRHPADDTLTAGFFCSFVDGSRYMVSGKHPDAPEYNLSELLKTAKQVWVPDSKEMYYYEQTQTFFDLGASLYTNNLPDVELEQFETNYHKMLVQTGKDYGQKYSQIIPLTKWYEQCESYCDEVRKVIDPSHTMSDAEVFYQTTVLPTLFHIESNGLYVDVDKWEHGYKPIGNLVYTDYYSFTTTGRPSNAFGGVNFAALNKSDGSRDTFVSRFGNEGSLVQFDFDAYHLRLLLNHLNITVEEPSLHTFLAKQYYNTDIITPEQYDESKQKTFAILYGSLEHHQNVPQLLKAVKHYEQELWTTYEQHGSFLTPKAHRKVTVQLPSPSKVFNYYVQSLEFESTIIKLHKLVDNLRSYRSKMVLYTYDAILVDMHKDEQEILVPLVKNVLEMGGFPVKMSSGNAYGELR